jgi:hypothetical protein
MLLAISKEKTIKDIQLDFNRQFPFLKLEFYKRDTPGRQLPGKKHLPHTITLQQAGLKDAGGLDVSSTMTVADLENLFSAQFGLDVQVLRKSGIVWLETTVTDQWSLEKQNEHGREISVTPDLPDVDRDT